LVLYLAAHDNYKHYTTYNGEKVVSALKLYDSFFDQLTSKLDNETLLVVTADHGG
jgi:phosphopentomutase